MADLDDFYSGGDPGSFQPLDEGGEGNTNMDNNAGYDDNLEFQDFGGGPPQEYGGMNDNMGGGGEQANYGDFVDTGLPPVLPNNNINNNNMQGGGGGGDMLGAGGGGGGGGDFGGGGDGDATYEISFHDDGDINGDNVIMDDGTVVDDDVPMDPSKARPWHVEYYRPLFDVDTTDVMIRLLQPFWPFGQNFFDFINPTPDLYGPFWVATTLMFLLAATGNFALWLEDLINHHTTAYDGIDFSLLPYGAVVCYGYLVVVSVGLWATCKWIEVPLSLMEHFCIYGYSMFVFVPACVLCAFLPVIGVSLLSWIVMLLAGLIGAGFLAKNYFPQFKATSPMRGLVMLIVMVSLHVILALSMKFFFFAELGSPDSGNGSGSGSSDSTGATGGGSTGGGATEPEPEAAF
eukprot:TRINITY_DN262_c0_g1_i1.p1 TRINITY_DN262_c0_g1~~TRINITY_DN262_c0_g1_i1.p1  ORF type:complete len:403 (-),score=139.76 TRINITY_DN262_c0_g1_i1:87-1295(-)